MVRENSQIGRTVSARAEKGTAAAGIGWTQNVVILEADLSISGKEWYIHAVDQFGWSSWCYEALDSTLGPNTTIQQSSPVAGGDINRACRLTLRDGKQVFLKTNMSAPTAFFQAEADGLAAIERTGAIRVPHVLALGADAKRCAFLLMEWIESVERKSEYRETFACQLAAMHRSGTSGLVPGGAYGWKRDNYIGAGAQVNTPKDNWISFFRDRRLAPQIQRAGHWFDAADRKRITRLLDHLDLFGGEYLSSVRHILKTYGER